MEGDTSRGADMTNGQTRMPRRPADMNQLAKRVVDLATGDATDEVPPATGRAKSAHARAASMTPERRKEIARKGAAARWGAQKELAS